MRRPTSRLSSEQRLRLCPAAGGSRPTFGLRPSCDTSGRGAAPLRRCPAGGAVAAPRGRGSRGAGGAGVPSPAELREMPAWTRVGSGWAERCWQPGLGKRGASFCPAPSGSAGRLPAWLVWFCFGSEAVTQYPSSDDPIALLSFLSGTCPFPIKDHVMEQA